MQRWTAARPLWSGPPCRFPSWSQWCSPGSLTETLPACLLFTSASFWPSRPAFCQRGPLSSVSRKPAGLPSGTVVKNLPATQEMPDMRLSPWVGKIPYEKGMATHSSTLAWVIPWTEELGRLQSMGSQRIKHDWVTKHRMCTYLIAAI